MTSFNLHPSVLRAYDIRGIIGETLTPEDAFGLGLGYAAIMHARGLVSIAVARDGRLSSPAIADRLIAGLVSGGLDVFDIGLGPTPMLYYAVQTMGADAGIMITGSHNAPDYNGFKMVMGGEPFFGDDIQELGRMVNAGEIALGTGVLLPIQRFAPSYVDGLLSGFTFQRPLSVVWDPGNEAAGPVIEAWKRLPGSHVVLNGVVDGRFPVHHPDPTVPANLDQLRQTVIERQADLGIAFDGDGDRLGAVDGHGRIVAGDQLLAILARFLLKTDPGQTIIADVKTSQAVFDEISDAGGEPMMWKTGHSPIKCRMKETGAALAGEMSGHIFFADRYFGFDDAIYAALRIIEVLEQSGQSLAQLSSRLLKRPNTPEIRLPCAETDKARVMARVTEWAASLDGVDVATLDGVRVTSEDG